jgi:hypothetical protein
MDCWVSQHIRRVVTNPVYIGTMTHHRTSKKSYKNKKTVCHPESEWIVLEDHHPPLVSKELFEEVQRTRRTFKRTKYTVKNRPFSGLLRCGRCGSPLVLRSRTGRPDAYICGKNHREGAVKDDIRPNYGCRPHHVREDILYDAVLGYIKRLLENSGVDVPALAKQLAKDDSPASTEALEEQLARLRQYIDQMYEDKLAGVIQEDFFLRKYQEFSRREEELSQHLQEACQAERTCEKNRLTAFQMEDIIQALSNKFVTKTCLRSLFDQIFVYEPNELRLEDAQRLGLIEEDARQLRFKGGIVFIENMAP